MPYDIPNKHVEYVRVEPSVVTTGFWRGVGPNNNVFAIESFVDELARKPNKDPVAFGLDMLERTPRRRRRSTVAEKSSWGKSLPAAWVEASASRPPSPASGHRGRGGGR